MENERLTNQAEADERPTTAKVTVPSVETEAGNIPLAEGEVSMVKPTAKLDAAEEAAQTVPKEPLNPSENPEAKPQDKLASEPEAQQETMPKPQSSEPEPELQVKPAEPIPEELTSEEQPIILDVDALCRYAVDYAVGTYGYEYWPGMRDGYYPAYTCYIETLEQGYAAIRECVDDLTLELNARGEPIVEYVDGIGYGMPFDVEIYPDPDGYENSYRVQLYY